MRISGDVYLAGSGKLGFDWTHPADCNVYAIDSGDGWVLIDSGTGLSVPEIERNLAAASGSDTVRIAYVLLTHLHADHAGGAAEIRRRSGCRVAVLERAASVLERGDETAIDLPRAREAGFYPADYRWQPCPVDMPFADGESFTLGRYKFTALHTPGHSAYDTCFYVEGEDRAPMLVSGDTVFYGGKISMLNTSDFLMGSLATSVARLAGLEPRLLLPGHGQPALDRASEHVRAAHHIFNKLGIPANIG